VDFDAFTESESDWPPPNYVKDVISGRYQIYHQGKFRDADTSEAAGLEQAAVWDAPHIVDRIVNEIENDSYRN